MINFTFFEKGAKWSEHGEDYVSKMVEFLWNMVAEAAHCLE